MPRHGLEVLLAHSDVALLPFAQKTLCSDPEAGHSDLCEQYQPAAGNVMFSQEAETGWRETVNFLLYPITNRYPITDFSSSVFSAELWLMFYRKDSELESFLKML